MRHEIIKTVEHNPGIHFREAKRQVGCSSTTMNYHLKDLDFREKMVHGYRRIYPEDVSEEHERPLAALNHDVRGLLLHRISGGVQQKQLVEETDLSKATISSHLKVLKKDGIVYEERNGRSKELSLSKSALKTLEEYASDMLDEASDGFIEMWE